MLRAATSQCMQMLRCAAKPPPISLLTAAECSAVRPGPHWLLRHRLVTAAGVHGSHRPLCWQAARQPVRCAGPWCTQAAASLSTSAPQPGRWCPRQTQLVTGHSEPQTLSLCSRSRRRLQ